jgi:hypothetical protein
MQYPNILTNPYFISLSYIILCYAILYYEQLRTDFTELRTFTNICLNI